MKLVLRAQTLGLLLALAPLCGRAETLIRLDLPQDYSRLAVREMKAELGRVVADADLDLRWELKSDLPASANGRMVSVELQGSCFGTPPPESYEDGPLGWTKTANGRVLPYIEIACGRIRSLLEPAWRDEPDAVRELQFGKALGRVLAHELAHALSRTEHHSSEGLRKRALSSRDLISGRYMLARSDFASRPVVQIAASRAPAVSVDAAPGSSEISDLGR